jgi:actin-related protein
MSLTPTLLYCSECGCQQIEAHKSYTVKAGGVRRLYYCPDCKGYFSETHNTPLANLKTPLSRSSRLSPLSICRAPSAELAIGTRIEYIELQRLTSC